MCGIAGAWGHQAAFAIDPMTQALAHRGPDGSGSWKAPDIPLFLGHRRLSILDHEGGIQPMHDASTGMTITFNGEIYNHAELRHTLIQKGHSFTSSHSDTEVILKAYAEWGPEMVHKFNGMWAFAIYDLNTKRIFISRDRFGQKPLYYARGEDWFAFSSELKSLSLHPGVDRSLSEKALIKYMAYGFIPAPYSMLAGAHKLPAGCHLVYDIQTGSTNIDSYWSYEQQPDSFIHERPLNEVKEEFYSLLGSAVQKRLGADVPVGCFLSGGLDSSTITSLATAQAGRDQIQTFNIAFDDASFDESIHAEKVSRFLNTHHRYETCTMDHARSLLDEIITGLDEPLGDASLLPTSLVSQIASKSVKVALGGDGADELLSGYDPFRALLPARYYRKAIPMPIHRFIQKLAGSLTVSHRNMSLDFKIKRTLRGLSYHPELWAPVWMAPISFSDLQILSGQTLDIEDVYSEAIAAWQRGFQAGGWHSALTQYYVQLYLQDNILTKIDRASMRYGLEVRSPFLDIDVINFIRTLPQSFRFRNGTSKWLLRQTMKQKVPNFVLQRSKKGFGVPAGKWLKDETVNIDTSSFPSSWSHSKVRELTHLHRSGQKDERASLWNIWILNKWHRSFTK